MKPQLSRLGLTVFGVAMAAAGASAMMTGWQTIQVERGWSLFIAGAVLLAGGAIIVALGEIAARLIALADRIDAMEISERPSPSAPAPRAPPARVAELRPLSDLEDMELPPVSHPAGDPFKDLVLEEDHESRHAESDTTVAEEPPIFEEPTEVDRYHSGDTTYVMFSDGSVEVRRGDSAERYASLAELRAQASGRK